MDYIETIIGTVEVFRDDDFYKISKEARNALERYGDFETIKHTTDDRGESWANFTHPGIWFEAHFKVRCYECPLMHKDHTPKCYKNRLDYPY